MPSSRRSRFAVSGMYQSSVPIRPMRLMTIATMSGSPARPRRTGMGRFEMENGCMPSSTPSAMPMNMVMKLVRLSSFTELPSTSPTFAMSASLATIWSESPNCA